MAKDGSAVPLSLLADLRLALAQADWALEKASTPENERIATLLALKAIYDFLKLAGLRSRALNNVSMALQDIGRGHAPTLFAPDIQNRPREGARLSTLKAASAAAMQLLMDSGKTKAEAGSCVAVKLNSAGFQLSQRSPKPVSATTVARWRDRFSGHSDEEGADIYAFVLETTRVADGTSAKRAQRVLHGLKRLVQNLEKLPS